MVEAVQICKALGEETRFLIVKNLLPGEKCACELPALIGRTQSNTSMHLAKLLEADILQQRREGKRIFYSLKDERVRHIVRLFDGDEINDNTPKQEDELCCSDATVCSIECTPKNKIKKDNEKNLSDCGGVKKWK